MARVGGATPVSEVPHVMFVGGVAQPWGAEIALLRLLEGLRGRARVTVVVLEDGPMVARYGASGADVIVLPMSQEALQAGRQVTGRGLGRVGSYLAVALRLTRIIRQRRPDFVVGNTLRGSAVAGPAARLSARPFVWMARDRLSSDYVSGVPRHLFRGLLRATSSGVIANSDATARTLPRHHRTLILHDPLADEFLQGVTEQPRGSGTVGMVGRLAAWKGHKLFLGAFSQVFRDTDRRARVVGGPSGSDAVSISELADYAEERGVASQVSFSGHVDDVLNEYREIDIFVHASLIPEPFGQVIAEALASGCLVVAPDAGGPAELIQDEENGFLYTMGSERSLAEALGRATTLPPDMRAAVSRNGRRTVERLSPEYAATTFIDFLADVRS